MPAHEHASRAVLVSGGLDSCVLLGQSLSAGATTVPVYIRSGLAWESREREYLARFLRALAGPRLRPLVTLEMPAADLYGTHWSMTGLDVPGAETPDEAVYLPGRNVILLAKSLVWCQLNGVKRLALAILRGNPFPDATPSFFAALEGAVNQAVGGSVRIETPYRDLSKADVIRRGKDLPLEHTVSCLQASADAHCGRCNKCAERRAAFRAAGVPDPTRYAH